MGRSSSKPQVLRCRAPGHRNAVPRLDLASQKAMKRAVSELRRLEMKRRLLSVLLACVAKVRRPVAASIAWLGCKDADATNQWNQLVLVHCSNALLELQIRLLQFSVSLQQFLILNLQRKQRLLDFVQLLKQIRFHGQHKCLVSGGHKPVGNSLSRGQR